MGGYLSLTRCNSKKPNAVKRKDLCETSDEEPEILRAKRLKLETTTKYIHERLFLNGEGSDIQIHCLNTTWNLHKLYLSQSPYFRCMFNGPWKEADQNSIIIDVPDDNITVSALNVAFGSLYCSELDIKSEEVVAVMAAAALFQLEDMVQLSSKIMLDSISLTTVGSFFDAAETYILPQVADRCVNWLQRVLMVNQEVTLLRSIGVEMMRRITHSPFFFVHQVEMDIYTMLKKWLFLSINKHWSGQRKELYHAKDDFFKQKASESEVHLLDRPDFVKYAPAFKGIRLQYIISDRASQLKLISEKILPHEWLLAACWSHWQVLLAVEQGIDAGPSPQLDEAKVVKCAMRCGRVLNIPDDYCWRWIGFNFGVDILMFFSQQRRLFIKRNISVHGTTHAVSMLTLRSVRVQVTATSYGNNWKQLYYKCSGFKQLDLLKDGEALVLEVDKSAPFPLYLSVLLLTFTPCADDYPPQIQSQTDQLSVGTLTPSDQMFSSFVDVS